MKNLKIKHWDRGFSLLETTVAVAILVTAVLGPLSLASLSIKSSSQAKNNLIAANLAQEGMELMRNFRANNVFVFGNSGWTAEMDSCFFAAGCQIDAATPATVACGASCSNLNFDQNSGLYSYDAGAPTLFIRTINIETVPLGLPPSTANEIKIIVSVSWQERFGLQEFALEEHLLNW